MQDQAQQVVRATTDIAAGGVTLAALIGWLPWFVTLLTGVIAVLRLYEMVSGNPAKTLFKRRT